MEVAGANKSQVEASFGTYCFVKAVIRIIGEKRLKATTHGSEPWQAKSLTQKQILFRGLIL